MTLLKAGREVQVVASREGVETKDFCVLQCWQYINHRVIVNLKSSYYILLLLCYYYLSIS